MEDIKYTWTPQKGDIVEIKGLGTINEVISIEEDGLIYVQIGYNDGRPMVRKFMKEMLRPIYSDGGIE